MKKSRNQKDLSSNNWGQISNPEQIRLRISCFVSFFNPLFEKKIANEQLEKSNERKDTEKKNWLVFSKIFNLWISNKKLDGLKALWIWRKIFETKRIRALKFNDSNFQSLYVLLHHRTIKHRTSFYVSDFLSYFFEKQTEKNHEKRRILEAKRFEL